jgi:hypothetical protein
MRWTIIRGGFQMRGAVISLQLILGLAFVELNSILWSTIVALTRFRSPLNLLWDFGVPVLVAIMLRMPVGYRLAAAPVYCLASLLTSGFVIVAWGAY